MVDPLSKLAISYGTDKIGYHDYMPNYYRLFKHLKDKPIKLLEIGVGGYQDADRGGESLEVWRDFFPKANIVGIDIQKKDMDLGTRVSIAQGSQIDAEFLEKIVRDHGPFDVIVDDGSHRNEHVVASFKLLYPGLAKGGIYVVEDVQTSFFPRFGGSLEMTAPNSVGFFGQMVRDFDKDSTQAEFGDIRQIDRFHNMVAMHKPAKSKAKISSMENMLKTRKSTSANVLVVGDQTASWDKFFSKGKVTSVKAGLSAKAFNAAVKGIGSLDIVIDYSKDNNAFKALFGSLSDTGYYAVADEKLASSEYFHELFTHVDHREIKINFPKAKINPLAKSTYFLARSKGAIIIEHGANDYPSNFDFDYDNPQAVKVLDAMETVLEKDGKERGLLLFADILTRAGDEERAAKMLKKLAGLGASSRSYFNMAVRRAKLDQDWDGAMILLRMAVATYPNDYRIRSQLGGVFSKEKSWPQAVNEFETGIQLNPKDALMRIQLANALSQLGEADDAVESAEVAVALLPKHAGHHVQLGRLQVNAGRYEEAVETLKKAIELQDGAPNAHRQLSRALYELGRNSEALQVVGVARDLAPDNQEYKRWQERLQAA